MANKKRENPISIDRLNKLFNNKINPKTKDHWKPQELAEKLNVSRSTITKYLNGELTIPLERLVIVADLFDTSVDYLLDRRDSPEYDQKKLDAEEYTRLSSGALDTIHNAEEGKYGNIKGVVSWLLETKDVVELLRNIKQLVRWKSEYIAYMQAFSVHDILEEIFGEDLEEWKEWDTPGFNQISRDEKNDIEMKINTTMYVAVMKLVTSIVDEICDVHGNATTQRERLLWNLEQSQYLPITCDYGEEEKKEKMVSKSYQTKRLECVTISRLLEDRTIDFNNPKSIRDVIKKAVSSWTVAQEDVESEQLRNELTEQVRADVLSRI